LVKNHVFASNVDTDKKVLFAGKNSFFARMVLLPWKKTFFQSNVKKLANSDG